MPHLRPKLCVRFAHVARCRFTCITRPACACAPLGRRVADPDFRGLQDELVDELYFFPAMTMAGKVGIVTPLGQMIMWDTMIEVFSPRVHTPLKAAIDAAGQAGRESSGTSSAAPRNRLPPRAFGARPTHGADLQRCLSCPSVAGESW